MLNFQKEFPFHRGVRQGCPLSPILFNMFINDILDKCKRYKLTQQEILSDDLISLDSLCEKLLLPVKYYDESG
jgi:retron-type reverse transcriptase